jgi:argininosuccinate synthase
MITSSQQRVEGETRVHLAAGRWAVTGSRSPYSMMDRSIATYGEDNRLWTGDEAKAFARVSAIPELLAMKAGEKGAQ